MVIKRSTEGAIQDVTDAKVAVFAQGVDTASTETKVIPSWAPSASRSVTQEQSLHHVIIGAMRGQLTKLAEHSICLAGPQLTATAESCAAFSLWTSLC